MGELGHEFKTPVLPKKIPSEKDIKTVDSSKTTPEQYLKGM
jgi:hypothetical protein